MLTYAYAFSGRFGRSINKLLKDRSGASALEYGVLAAVMVAAVVVAANTFGAQFGTLATKVQAHIDAIN